MSHNFPTQTVKKSLRRCETEWSIASVDARAPSFLKSKNYFVWESGIRKSLISELTLADYVLRVQYCSTYCSLLATVDTVLHDSLIVSSGRYRREYCTAMQQRFVQQQRASLIEEKISSGFSFFAACCQPFCRSLHRCFAIFLFDLSGAPAACRRCYSTGVDSVLIRHRSFSMFSLISLNRRRLRRKAKIDKCCRKEPK